MMKVSELIQILQQYDPEKKILLSGYEGGYYEARGTIPKTVVLNVHEEWYYGPHDDDDYYGVKEMENPQKEEFIYIN